MNRITRFFKKKAIGLYQTFYLIFFKHKKIIIFNVREKNLLPFFKNLIKEFGKNPSIKIILSAEGKTNRVSLKKYYSYKIFSSEYLVETWGKNIAVISADFHSRSPKKSIHINIFHNQPVKYITFPKRKINEYDYFFAWGDFYKEYLIKYLKIDNSKIFLTGCPMLDSLYQYNGNNKLYNKLKLDSNKKTILYAPSWNPGLSLRTRGDEIIELLSKFKQFNIIVRLHPASLFNKNHSKFEKFTGGINWEEKLNKWIKKYENVFDGNHYDSVEYLKISDILITDFSSISFDFYCQNKPVIFIHSEEYFNYCLSKEGKEIFGDLKRNDLTSNDFINGGRSYGSVINDFSGLEVILTRFIRGKDLRPNNLYNLSKRLLINKGNSSKVVYETTMSLL